MFKEIPSVPDLVNQEKAIIDYWKQIDVVNALKNLRKGKPEKVYYDGPITANNLPHYGHTIQWTLKDLIPRYWSMKGYFVSRNMGWDCQGIPVELEIEQKIGIERKEDIEKFGVAKFNDLCRQSIFEYRDAIYKYETLVGRWFDETDMYYTMDKNFIESMWWSLKELYAKGLLYEGHKSIAYSTKAGCTMSTHEVNYGGYKELEDSAITVKFKLKTTSNGQNEPSTFILAWTTTPWTIPGNLMLAVGKDIKYVKVNYNNELYILAEDCLKEVFKEKEYKVVQDLTAQDLVGQEYESPFKYFENKKSEGCFKIVIAGHVTTEEGTGIVHLAPYGAEDFDIFMGLGIQLFDYLDDSGHFTDLIPEYNGFFYKNANAKIIEDLQGKNLLFNQETIVHRMPMCWRTNTPLIYKPIKSWYIAVTKIKQRLIEENNKVNWVPSHIGTGRVGNWLEGAKDWAISRKRYWGTPIPVWVNDKTGEKIVIGSFAELKEKSGADLQDPHKPYVDEITWEDKEKGGTFKRIPDVIDVWYDSGSMPFAQLHYPFDNKDKLHTKFPAQYVCEAVEQDRLWFYTLLVINVALFDKVPYENVVAHGIMVDEKGKKLSKSKKNYPPMDKVLGEYGGDILRYFILTSPIVKGEDAGFYDAVLADVRKAFFIPLWNSLKYFVTYANVYNFEPTLNTPESKHVLDKWILVRLQETTNLMTEKLDQYLIMEACRALEPLLTDLSTWYIRRSRDHIKNGDTTALGILYYVLSQMSKLMAPVLPFMAEVLYEALDLHRLTGLASVHFDMYPEAHALTAEETELLENMATTRGIVSSALSIRVSKNLKVRQPLSELYLDDAISGNYFPELILDEVNVKTIHKGEPKNVGMYAASENTDYKVWLNTEVTTDLKIEGRSREMIRQLQDLRKEAKLLVTDKIKATYTQNPEADLAVQKFGDDIKQKVQALELAPGSKYEIFKI